MSVDVRDNLLLKEDGDHILQQDTNQIIVDEIATTKGTKGTRFIATRWPVVKGLEAGIQKQTGNVMNLVPQSSNVLPRNRDLI